MRSMPLSSILAGITRLRVKGGASQQSLYDCNNGFVTNARSMQIRPGSLIDAKLPAGTKGLCGFQGKLVVFANEVVAPPSTKYEVAVIRHPTQPTLAIHEIHFAAPYVGALYVAAEFSNGDVYHYWLQDASTWLANTIYKANDTASPTVNNGFAYKATRLIDSFPAWAPRVPRAIGDRIEPSTYTGFYYQVTAVAGSQPISGNTEPPWPTLEGQTVIEELTAGGDTTVETIPPEPGSPPSGGDPIDPYCVHMDSWMGNGLQAKDYFIGLMADLHSPERGFFRGPCKQTQSPKRVPCVRLITETASVVVSRTTPVNFSEAVADLSNDTWAYAPEMLGRRVLVEQHVELVLEVEDVGEQWVMPMNFGDNSFAASEIKDAPRIFTHNIRAQKDPSDELPQ
jgi:hypothetical protein